VQVPNPKDQSLGGHHTYFSGPQDPVGSSVRSVRSVRGGGGGGSLANGECMDDAWGQQGSMCRLTNTRSRSCP
jgi:hypothetical protein